MKKALFVAAMLCCLLALLGSPVTAAEVQAVPVELKASQDMYALDQEITLVARFEKLGQVAEGFWACGTPMELESENGVYTSTVTFEWLYPAGHYTLACNVTMIDQEAGVTYEGRGSYPVTMFDVQNVKIQLTATKDRYRIDENITLLARFPEHAPVAEAYWACGTPMDLVLAEGTYNSRVAFPWEYPAGHFTTSCNVVMIDEEALMMYRARGEYPILVLQPQTIEIDLWLSEAEYKLGSDVTIHAAFPKQGDVVTGRWSCGRPMEFSLDKETGRYVSSLTMAWWHGEGTYAVGCWIKMECDEDAILYEGTGQTLLKIVGS